MGNPSPAGRRRLLVLCTIYTSNSRSSLNIVHPLFIRDHGWKIFGNRVRGVKDAGRRERWGRGRPIQIQMLIDPAMDPSHCIYRQRCMQPTFRTLLFQTRLIYIRLIYWIVFYKWIVRCQHFRFMGWSWLGKGSTLATLVRKNEITERYADNIQYGRDEGGA